LPGPPAPSPPSSAASLALLHPELQRHIGSFLSAKDAVFSVGSASRACRLDFLAGVTHARLAPKPLQLEPSKPEEEHAASLACLLSQLPSLKHIGYLDMRTLKELFAGAQSTAMNRMLGLACRRLEAPLANVTFVETSHLGAILGPTHIAIGPDEPHPLAQALAEGRFPALQQLDTRVWSFWQKDENARLLEQALMGGHLTRLERLSIDAGPALDALCRGSRQAPPVIQQRQVLLRGLDITDHGDHVINMENLEAALRLPCFARLEEIKLFFGTEGRMLDVLAHYIQHVEGAPSLRSLALTFFDPARAGLGPLVHALWPSGGAPNLKTFSLWRAGRQTFEDLGAIYAAGGLARLRTLGVVDPELTEEGMSALLEGVEASAHQGAAVRCFYVRFMLVKLDFTPVQAQFTAAQARGIFPNAAFELS
jgi:hypothetical protein